MKHISSRENAIYKRLVRLASGKRDPDHADQEGHAGRLLEGVHLCQSWLQHMGAPELAVFDAERLERSEELRHLAKAVDERVCVSCEPRLAKALSQVEHGQGVYFLVNVPEPAPPSRVEHNCLWLDRVQDPGNVGTLLRTAAAAGLRHVYLSQGCASAWAPKVLRSAQGAHFVLSIYERVNLLALATKRLIPMVATALADAQPLYETSLARECIWLMGNEGQGVDESLLAQADTRVFIPQEANVESLNVAVAAGICLFEQRRQHTDQSRNRSA